MTEPMPPELPRERPAGCPFDPPAELAVLREQDPLTRLRFPDGHIGWLATGHTTVRAVLADPRFSARSEYLRRPRARSDAAGQPRPGMFLRYDPPEHTRFRTLLTARFTARRMRQLTRRVEEGAFLSE